MPHVGPVRCAISGVEPGRGRRPRPARPSRVRLRSDARHARVGAPASAAESSGGQPARPSRAAVRWRCRSAQIETVVGRHRQFRRVQRADPGDRRTSEACREERPQFRDEAAISTRFPQDEESPDTPPIAGVIASRRRRRRRARRRRCVAAGCRLVPRRSIATVVGVDAGPFRPAAGWCPRPVGSRRRRRSVHAGRGRLARSVRSQPTLECRDLPVEAAEACPDVVEPVPHLDHDRLSRLPSDQRHVDAPGSAGAVVDRELRQCRPAPVRRHRDPRALPPDVLDVPRTVGSGRLLEERDELLADGRRQTCPGLDRSRGPVAAFDPAHEGLRDAGGVTDLRLGQARAVSSVP